MRNCRRAVSKGTATGKGVGGRGVIDVTNRHFIWVTGKQRMTEILYFIDRASRYKFLVITNSTHFFMYLFISCLYMFRASQRSSSGDRIVLIHHLV